MTQQSLIASMSPEAYAERVLQQRQRALAAQIDPGYLIDDTPQDWAVGMVLGWVEEGEPEHPVSRTIWRVRHAVAVGLERLMDTVDPTVRYRLVTDQSQSPNHGKA